MKQQPSLTISIDEWECTRCGNVSDSWTSKPGDGVYARCWKCEFSLGNTEHEFLANVRKREVRAKVCPRCKGTVGFFSSNARSDGMGFMCWHGHYTWYGVNGLEPERLLKPSHAQIDRSRIIDGQRVLARAGARDRLVAAVLLDMAREEDSSFTSLPIRLEPRLHSLLLIDGSAFVGYIAYSEDLGMVVSIGQIFIRREFRHRGLATLLVRAVAQEASDQGRKLTIESPSEATLHLLAKMKFCQTDGDHYIGSGVSFVNKRLRNQKV